MTDYTYPTDAESEAVLDARVQRRLASDAAYRNAANADEQNEREREIEQQEVERFYDERLRASAARKQTARERHGYGSPEHVEAQRRHADLLHEAGMG